MRAPENAQSCQSQMSCTVRKSYSSANSFDVGSDSQCKNMACIYIFFDLSDYTIIVSYKKWYSLFSFIFIVILFVFLILLPRDYVDSIYIL